uniref:RNA-directed DNA polymerase n=1 Tax=Tanacetum cinerariifolium TaxID=118510 RepID=A0A699IX35_TANCI|nr:hypothetical protein [Tanacetum cinerariifolium]
MADNRTMAELLQATTEGYEDAIVISKVAVNNFELKHSLINLVQNKQFFGHDKEDPHAHIRYFNKITSTMRVPNVLSSSIKLMFFPFSLEGTARIWLEKEPPRSILNWDDLVSKFINQFFPPSKTTNLRNEITRFQQRFDESFYKAWDRFNDLLRACPHYGFSKLHQLDKFYNALNVNYHDSLNSAAGGNFLDKMPRECLKIIESKSRVHQSRAKVVVAKVSTSSSTPAISSEVAELKDMVRALLLDKKNQSLAPAHSLTPALVKAVNQPPAYQAPAYQAPIPQTQSVSKTDFESYVKANDAILRNMQNQGQNMQNQFQNLQIQMANLMDMLSKFVSFNTASSSGSGTLPNNTITNPKEKLKGITTRSGVAYQGPTIPTPSKVVKQRTEVTKDQVQTPSSQSTAPVQPPVVQFETQTPVSEPIVAPVSAPMPNLKSSIPYPSRRDNERHQKLSEMPRTLMNEHCSTVILDKLPRKLRDPGKFLIPCEFPGMDECLALADLGASINLMPLSVWEGILLPELTLTCMTLELADRLVSKPIGIAKDVSVKVGVFHFPADFIFVDFKPDPRVSLIFRRCFLKTSRALIDVHKGKLTLRIGNKAITYNLDQTSRYSANYNQMTANKIDVIDMACKDYSQEVLDFSDVTSSGNPTPHDDPIVSTTSPTLTPFGDSDFLLFEEADAFLGLEDDLNSPKINPFYYDPEVDILLLEAILNSKPLPPLPNHEQYLPSFKKKLKVFEAKTVKYFVDEPPEVELKDLPPHLEYAFLEGDNKLPVIIAKELGDEEKSALIKENTTFTCPYETFAYRRMPFGLCNAPGTFQRCEDTNLYLNWEKNHFMVKEGIVLGHKISKNGIKVDKAKVDVIAKLPHPTTVKEKLTKAPILITLNWELPFELMCEASDFAIGALLGQRHEKHFRPIHYASKTMINAESNYTTTKKEMLAVVYAFEKFWSYLIMNKSIVHTDHSALKYLFAKKDANARLLRWVLLL